MPFDEELPTTCSKDALLSEKISDPFVREPVVEGPSYPLGFCGRSYIVSRLGWTMSLMKSQ